jgi:hypothetical protein
MTQSQASADETVISPRRVAAWLFAIALTLLLVANFVIAAVISAAVVIGFCIRAMGTTGRRFNAFGYMAGAALTIAFVIGLVTLPG